MGSARNRGIIGAGAASLARRCGRRAEGSGRDPGKAGSVLAKILIAQLEELGRERSVLLASSHFLHCNIFLARRLSGHVAPKTLQPLTWVC